MSASTSHDTLASGTHAHPNPDTHGDGHDHGTRRTYLIGFALSVILTAIPFWLVMADVISDTMIATIVIMGFGVVQIFVHMVYFLHMNGKAEGGWNMLALIFTAVVVLIVISGSMWVMYHMNHNMMPMHAEQMD